MKKKAIFFDVDDTLYNQMDTFGRAYKEVFGDRFDLNMNELFEARSRRGDEVFEDSQKGIITMEAMHIYRGQKAFADLGAEITEEEALEFQYAYARNQQKLIMPEVIKQLLDELKEQEVILGVITNGPSAHQWNKVNVLNMKQWIPEQNLIVSGDLGINKPDRRIFDAARERADAEECWFVGDSYVNDIVGGHNAGWKTIWLNRTRRELQPGETQPDVMVYDEKEMCEKIRAIGF